MSDFFYLKLFFRYLLTIYLDKIKNKLKLILQTICFDLHCMYNANVNIAKESPKTFHASTLITFTQQFCIFYLRPYISNSS